MAATMVTDVLGNTADPMWTHRLGTATVDTLRLDQWEAQKNRLRKHTEGGTEVTMSIGRGTQLRDGDVLWWDEAGVAAIVARIDLGEVLVADLGGLLDQDPAALLRTAVELGHAIGNQHWPAVIKGTRVYVPLTVDRTVTNAVMRTHALPGVEYSFVAGEEAIPFLAPHEARRLFGGAGATPHSHAPA